MKKAILMAFVAAFAVSGLALANDAAKPTEETHGAQKHEKHHAPKAKKPTKKEEAPKTEGATEEHTQ